MMSEHQELAGKKIKYHVVSPDIAAARTQSGDADMAVLPTNAAATLYVQTGYQYAAALTNGNLFLIGPDLWQNAELYDLKGKVVGCIGKNNVPDRLFRCILNQKGIAFEEGNTVKADTVVIRYFDNGTTLTGFILAGNLEYGLLAEPDMTNSLYKLNNEGFDFKQLFNLQWELGKLIGTAGFPQAGLVVKPGLDRNFVDAFLEKCKEGNADGGWAKNNPYKAVEAINANKDGTSTVVLLPGKEAAQIEGCNIFTSYAEKIWQEVDGFLEMIGVVRPGMEFYYINRFIIYD